MITSVVVFDSRVPDLARLRDGLVPGTRGYVLDQARDGVRQIAEILARDGLTDLADLSLVAHGRPGGIAIGATYLDGDNLPRYAARLAEIGAALTADGSVRLYACDVAFGPRGRAFVDDLARILGVDVAAAAHGVGGTEFGGCWSLDVATGASAQPPFTPAAMERYAGLLGPGPFNTAPLFRVDGTGKILTPVGAGQSDDQGNGMTLLPGGKILIAGSGQGSADTDFALVRFTADGVLDETFGASGIVLTSVGAASTPDQGYSVSVLPNGKIIVAGVGTGSGGQDFAVVRYNADGSLDTDFGTGGKVLTPVGAGTARDTAFGMSVDSTGRVVLAGTSEDNGVSSLAVVRYTVDGTLDTTFGDGGKILTPVNNGGFFGRSVSVDADDKIVVAGYGTGDGGDNDFVVARYRSNGSLDTSFGTDGKVVTPVGAGNLDDSALSVTLANGQIVVSGESVNADGSRDFSLVRYNSDGSLDTDFGTDGKVVTPVGPGASYDFGRSVRVQADGKIVVAGSGDASFEDGGSGTDFAVVRYNSDGSLDTDFGRGSHLDNAVAFTEGDAPVRLAPEVNLEDAELDGRNGGLGDYAGASLTIARTGGATAEDVFGFPSPPSGFTVSGNELQNANHETFATFTAAGGTLVVSFTGTNLATSALADAVARAVTYANTSDAPPPQVSLDWSFSDGGPNAKTVTGLTTVAITAVNDAPTATNLSASETYTKNEPLDLTDIVVTDVDSTDVTATLTLSDAAAGTLSTSDTATYDPATGIWSIKGSVAAVNAALAAVTFTRAPNFTEPFTIVTSVSDDGAPPATGSKTFTYSDGNTAPTRQPGTDPTLDEGGTATITSAQLAFADAEQDATEITFTVSSVSHGTLRRDGNALGPNDSFTQDDIDHDRISFVHDGSETLSAGFDFSVSDGEGGGVTGQSFAFGVTASNDAPTLFVKSVIDVLQGGTVPLSELDLFAKDIDIPADELTYSVSETIHGKIIVDGHVASTFTQAQLAGGVVGFRQDGVRDKTASFTVTVSDGSLVSAPKTVTANVDLVPVVTGIAYGAHDGTLRAGESVQFLVSLSEAVTVDGIPSLTLSDGGTAHYIPGSSTTKLLFSYIVAPGQTSADLAVTGLSFTDGTIRDAAGQSLAALPTGGIDPNGTLVVDGVAPTLTIRSDASQLRAGESATISFTFSEKPGVSFTADDIVVKGGTLSALSGTGLTRTAIFTPTAGMNAGTASITVATGAYTDAAGNPGKAGTSPTLTFDTTADAAGRAILSVDGTGDGVINAAEATAVAFTVAGLDPDASAVATFTGGSLSRSVTMTADGGGTVDLSGFTGIVTSRLSITDKAGNSAGVVGNSVKVDTAVPGTPTGLSLAAGSDSGPQGDGLTDDATPTITGLAEAGSLITLYRGTTVLGSARADATGAFSITASPLGEGRQSLTVRAMDAAGNPGAASASLDLTIDTTAPAAPTIRLTHDTGASAGDGITFDPAFTVGAAEAGGTLLYKVDGATVFGTTKPVFATDGSDDGAHTIAVAQQDGAGTLGATASVSFTLDTIAPRVAIAGVEGATNVVGHTIVGSADANGTVTVTQAGAVFGTVTTGADGAWELPYVFRGDGPQVGYGFAAVQTDLAGNVGSDSFDFALDFTPNRDLFGDVITDAGSAAGQVYTLYDGLLGRTPDANGLRSFVPALEAGASLHDVAQAILNSAEFTDRFGDVSQASDAAFVGELYQIALGRGADAAGEQTWLASLADGTSRADVAVSFAFSAENQAQIASALRSGVFVPDAAETDVARLYYGLLDRAPDAGGLQAWSNSVKAGDALTEVAQDILASAEYGALHPGGQSAAQYVASLYGGALGRASGTAEQQGWLDALAQGSSRAEVAVGIAESIEAHQHLVGKIEAGWHLT